MSEKFILERERNERELWEEGVWQATDKRRWDDEQEWKYFFFWEMKKGTKNIEIIFFLVSVDEGEMSKNTEKYVVCSGCLCCIINLLLCIFFWFYFILFLSGIIISRMVHTTAQYDYWGSNRHKNIILLHWFISFICLNATKVDGYVQNRFSYSFISSRASLIILWRLLSYKIIWDFFSLYFSFYLVVWDIDSKTGSMGGKQGEISFFPTFLVPYITSSSSSISLMTIDCHNFIAMEWRGGNGLDGKNVLSNRNTKII